MERIMQQGIEKPNLSLPTRVWISHLSPGANHKDAAVPQQATMLLASVLQSFCYTAEVQDSQGSSQHLSDLAKHQGLAARLEGSMPEEAFSAVISLSWGVLLELHGPPTFRGKDSPASLIQRVQERDVYIGSGILCTS